MSQITRLIWSLLPNWINRVIKIVLVRLTVNIHPNAASNGSGMAKWTDRVHELSNIKIQNLFEIGANYGQDAEFMRQYLGLRSNNVYVFEPHPQIVSEVRKYYKFNTFDYAVSNNDGFTVFHAINLSEYNNSGISSLLKHNYVDEKFYFDTTVALWRMDTFMREHNIESVDFVKIDVEGCTYEVLEGFGERIRDVKCIQLEAEHVKLFEGQRLFGEISSLLCKNNFVMAHFELLDGKQSDSLWIQKNYLKD